MHRVLLIEDEVMIGLMAETMLLDMGNWVIGPISRLDPAVAAARRVSADCAVLDINIAGESIYPVADILAERGIPFVFATAYSSIAADGPFGDRPVVQKPYLPKELQAAIDAAVREGSMRHR